ncbi:MAG: ferrochelatase [Myxococcota bacterium]
MPDPEVAPVQASATSRCGVLLINLGTPDSPRTRDVRRYLREFLSDPLVLDMPGPLRRALLELVILPFRPRRSARAYASIWGEGGSPLLRNSRALRDALAARLGDGYAVELGMRYGQPSLAQALAALASREVSRVIVVPLFPQLTRSTTGSALERLHGLAARLPHAPPLQSVPPFYAHPEFVGALAAVLAPALESFPADHLLMSYHGLPERHLHRADPSGEHCLQRPDCCQIRCPSQESCYRAQCLTTSRALAGALGLPPDRWSTAFQSRLGPAAWIRPQTTAVLPTLAQRGVRRIAVVCPSFVADCLETLEEIGLRAREQWMELGGEDFLLLPCLNAEPRWVAGLAKIVLDVQAKSVST